MKRVLVVQHVAYEILGTLDPLLRASKIRIRYVNFSRSPEERPDISKYDGLILLGGPMSAYQMKDYPHLQTEVDLIKEAIAKGCPVLGICLGAQLIATALGGRVSAGKRKEIGWFNVSLTKTGQTDDLLGIMNSEEKIFQWHGDYFELPPGAEHLASTKDCKFQAFRYGERTYGFQFHLEVDEPMIERWLGVPHHKAEVEEEKLDPDVIRKETKENISRSLELSRQVFQAFIDRFSTKARKVSLGSAH